jgi:hypothetical protein
MTNALPPVGRLRPGRPGSQEFGHEIHDNVEAEVRQATCPRPPFRPDLPTYLYRIGDTREPSDNSSRPFPNPGRFWDDGVGSWDEALKYARYVHARRALGSGSMSRGVLHRHPAALARLERDIGPTCSGAVFDFTSSSGTRTRSSRSGLAPSAAQPHPMARQSAPPRMFDPDALVSDVERLARAMFEVAAIRAENSNTTASLLAELAIVEGRMRAGGAVATRKLAAKHHELLEGLRAQYSESSLQARVRIAHDRDAALIRRLAVTSHSSTPSEGLYDPDADALPLPHVFLA